MLRLAVAFLLIALMSGVFGFGSIAHLSWAGAQFVFVVFLLLAAIAFLFHLFQKETFWR